MFLLNLAKGSEVELGSRALHQLRRIANALEEIAIKLTPVPVPEPGLTILGGKFMFILPADQPDVRFSVSAVSAQDSEGNSIALTEELTSDNESVISFLYDEGSSASNPRAGAAHVGAPGLANVNYTAKDPSGDIVASEGAQFTVIAGEAAVVSGGDLSFEGISEEPAPTPEG